MKKYPLAVTLNAIFHENKILLIHRVKAPYKNYWTMPGGKIELGEHIDESAVRECHEETGLFVTFEKIVGITNEVIHEQGKIKSHYLLFVCKLRASTTDFVESKEGKGPTPHKATRGKGTTFIIRIPLKH